MKIGPALYILAKIKISSLSVKSGLASRYLAQPMSPSKQL